MASIPTNMSDVSIWLPIQNGGYSSMETKLKWRQFHKRETQCTDNIFWSELGKRQFKLNIYIIWSIYIRVYDIWRDYLLFQAKLPTTHRLGLGHETMVCVVCLSVFLFLFFWMTKYVADFRESLKQINRTPFITDNITNIIWETNNTIKYNEPQYQRGRGLEYTNSETGCLLCLNA